MPPKDNEKDVEPVVIDLSDCFFSAEPTQRQANAMDLGKAAQERKANKGNSEYTQYDTRYSVLEKSVSFLRDPFGSSDDNAIIQPPYPLQKLSNLSEISVVRSSCIRAIAQNTVGLGYSVTKLDPSAEQQDTDVVSNRIVRMLEKWSSRDDCSFTELLYKVKTDEESMGSGYVEVSRKINGEIDGFWHVSGATVRVLVDQYTDSDRNEGIPVKPSFVQIKNGKEIPFYRFGDKTTIDEEGVHHYREGAHQKINELIQFKLYPSKSDDYGAPRDISAIPSIAGDEMARNHNIKYFTNSATPEMAIIFEVDTKAFPQIAGDQPVKVSIPEPMKRQIIKHFREGLSSPNFQPGIFYLPAGISVRFEQLSKGQTDSGWTKYRQDARNEVRSAFQVPSVIIGDESSSRTSAPGLAAKAEFLEQVIAPEQHRYSQRIMNRIWPELTMITASAPKPQIDINGDQSLPAQISISPEDGTGVDPEVWSLSFNVMSTSDKTVDANANNIYGSLGVLDINEIRQSIDRPPRPGGDISPAEVKARLAASISGTGTPSTDTTVKAPSAEPPDPKDLRGLGGLPGHGRSINGMINGGLARRVGDLSTPPPANFATAGTPVSKAVESEYEEETEIEEELIENLDPEVSIHDFNSDALDFNAERYFEKVEEGFNILLNQEINDINEDEALNN